MIVRVRCGGAAALGGGGRGDAGASRAVEVVAAVVVVAAVLAGVRATGLEVRLPCAVRSGVAAVLSGGGGWQDCPPGTGPTAAAGAGADDGGGPATTPPPGAEAVFSQVLGPPTTGGGGGGGGFTAVTVTEDCSQTQGGANLCLLPTGQVVRCTSGVTTPTQRSAESRCDLAGAPVPLTGAACVLDPSPTPGQGAWLCAVPGLGGDPDGDLLRCTVPTTDVLSTTPFGTCTTTSTDEDATTVLTQNDRRCSLITRQTRGPVYSRWACTNTTTGEVHRCEGAITTGSDDQPEGDITCDSRTFGDGELVCTPPTLGGTTECTNPTDPRLGTLTCATITTTSAGPSNTTNRPLHCHQDTDQSEPVLGPLFPNGCPPRGNDRELKQTGDGLCDALEALGGPGYGTPHVAIVRDGVLQDPVAPGPDAGRLVNNVAPQVEQAVQNAQANLDALGLDDPIIVPTPVAIVAPAGNIPDVHGNNHNLVLGYHPGGPEQPDALVLRPNANQRARQQIIQNRVVANAVARQFPQLAAAAAREQQANRLLVALELAMGGQPTGVNLNNPAHQVADLIRQDPARAGQVLQRLDLTGPRVLDAFILGMQQPEANPVADDLQHDPDFDWDPDRDGALLDTLIGSGSRLGR